MPRQINNSQEAALSIDTQACWQLMPKTWKYHTGYWSLGWKQRNLTLQGSCKLSYFLLSPSFYSWEEGFQSQGLSAENYSQAIKFTPKENKQKTEGISSDLSNARHKKVRRICNSFSPPLCLQDSSSILTFLLKGNHHSKIMNLMVQ